MRGVGSGGSSSSGARRAPPAAADPSKASVTIQSAMRRKDAIKSTQQQSKFMKDVAKTAKATTTAPIKPAEPEAAARKAPPLPQTRARSTVISREPEWRSANKDFVTRDIVLPMVDVAVLLGEKIFAARARQAEFESRPLQKAVCVASLVGTSAVSGDAHSSLGVVEEDGVGLIASRAELLKLSMHQAPLPQLGVSPLVRQTEQQAAELPTTTPIHSVSLDAVAARAYCLHADGHVLVWGVRTGDLRHSASVLPAVAMATAPPQPLLRADEESRLIVLDASWHDGTIKVLEPLSLEVLASIPVAPGEPAGSRRVAHMLYVDIVQLVLYSLEGSPAVYGCDSNSGSPCVQLGGHAGTPPALRWLSRPQRLATLGGGLSPFAASEADADCSVRLWKLQSEGLPADRGGGADGVASVSVLCERVLLGHTAAVIDATYLPDASLLVTASLDRTVRFWDAMASQHLLTAPEGGAHVRVGPGRYEPLRPEWTASNTPYVNCLVISTQEVPLSLAPMSNWRGPEAILLLTARPQASSVADAVAQSGGGTLALWAVTRASISVTAKRFDEVLARAQYNEIEATAAREWRGALMRLREAEAGYGSAPTSQQKRMDAAHKQTMRLLRTASLERPSLSAEVIKSTTHEVFLAAIQGLERKANWASNALQEAPSADSTLTLAEVQAICRQHELLCAPVHNLQGLRRWLQELRRLSPLRPSNEQNVSSTPLMGQADFRRLMVDLDPFARLRDTAFELNMHATALAKKSRSLRACARFSAEAHAKRWAHLSHTVLASLDALEARLRSHATRQLGQRIATLLPPPAAMPPPRGRPARLEMPPGRPPKYDVNTSKPILSAADPPRLVYEAASYRDGAAVGCVAVVPRNPRLSSSRRLSSRPQGEHVALEVAASRALADACALFTRSLGFALAPPSPQQREDETHILFESLPKGLPLPELIKTNGPLAGVPSEEGASSAAALTPVLALWGRQLLLALQAAHRRGILLRTLRLSHIVVTADGQHLKLGPSALANFALTNGSLRDGGGVVVTTNDLPPPDGPLSRAILQIGQPPPAAGASAAAGAAPPPMATPETLLPPELLTRELLRARDDLVPPPPTAEPAALEDVETLSSAVDVWNFGLFLFHAYYGEDAAAYPSTILRQILDSGAEPRSALAKLLSHMRAQQEAAEEGGTAASAPPSSSASSAPMAYNPFAELKAAAGGGAGGGARPIPRAKASGPSLPDIIAACLQPSPEMRPTVDALLASDFFSLHQTELLMAKRLASQYVQLPSAEGFVEAHFGGPLRELNELRLGAGRVAVHEFERLVQLAHDCCVEPLLTMSQTGSAPSGGGADAETDACEALVAQMIGPSDVFGCLRLICLQDLKTQVELSREPAARSDPRNGCVLKLGATLRKVIRDACIDGTFAAPHLDALCEQLIALASGEAKVAPTACLADQWMWGQRHGGDAQAVIASPGAAASLRAAAAEGVDDAAMGAIVLAPPAPNAAATGKDIAIAPVASAGALALPTPPQLYPSLIYNAAAFGAPWQYFAPRSEHCWSSALQVTIHPTLDAVLGDDARGISHSLAASYCADMITALASLKCLQSEKGREGARARVTALTHFVGILRRSRAAIRLCADLDLPQRAFATLFDRDPDVRTAAFALFAFIAKLQPDLRVTTEAADQLPSISDEEAAAACELLRGCFCQHAILHALARPLHDTSEHKAVRAKAAELMVSLADSDQPGVRVALTRADVWSALPASYRRRRR